MPLGPLSRGRNIKWTWLVLTRIINSGAVILGVRYFGLPILLLLALDCGMGNSEATTGTVVDRLYEPPKSDVQCDKNGCETIHYPARFVLIVDVKDNSDDFIDVDVSRKVYYSATQNMPVEVLYRRGRLSKFWYFPHINKEKLTNGNRSF